MRKICKNCEWFEVDDSDEYGHVNEEEVGDCERFPPVFVPMFYTKSMDHHKKNPKDIEWGNGTVTMYNGHDESLFLAHQYARVHWWQRCGEWKAREAK